MDEARLVHALMAEIGPEMQLGEVRGYEERRLWLLGVDEARVLYAEHDPDEGRLWLSAEVGAPPAADRAEVLERLMLFNAQWLEAGGYRLALDAPGGAVVLACDLRVEGLTLARFRTAIGNFLEALDAWRRVVAAGVPGRAAMVEPAGAGAIRG